MIRKILVWAGVICIVITMITLAAYLTSVLYPFFISNIEAGSYSAAALTLVVIVVGDVTAAVAISDIVLKAKDDTNG